MFVLVTSWEPLEVWLYSACYCRFASEPYSVRGREMFNRFAHLCNYSINRHAKTFTDGSSAPVADAVGGAGAEEEDMDEDEEEEDEEAADDDNDGVSDARRSVWSHRQYMRHLATELGSEAAAHRVWALRRDAQPRRGLATHDGLGPQPAQVGVCHALQL